MTFYEAFLIRALELCLPQPLRMEVDHREGVKHIQLPDQKAWVEYRGLWSSSGFALPEQADAPLAADANDWRRLIVEESLEAHGVSMDETAGKISVQRIEAKAIKAGIRRCVLVSEYAISYLLKKEVHLTERQRKECSEYAMRNTAMGRKIVKKRGHLERAR